MTAIKFKKTLVCIASTLFVLPLLTACSEKETQYPDFQTPRTEETHSVQIKPKKQVRKLDAETQKRLNNALIEEVYNAPEEEMNMAEIRSLLEQGADVNAANDDSGRTVLFYALYRCNPKAELARLLIDNGANINAKATNGGTMLHAAASGNSPDMVKFLLEKGLDVNAKTDMGMTPLHYASAGRDSCDHKCQTKKVQLLLDKGADVNAQDNLGITPLHFASGYGSHTDTVLLLLNNGANINIKDSNGETVLHHALSNPDSNFDTVQLLVRNGADVHAKNNYSETALHMYTMNTRDSHKTNTEITQWLLEKGLSVNAQNNDGRTPLMNAAFNGNATMVQWLINQGADVNIKNNDGKTAIEEAKKMQALAPEKKAKEYSEVVNAIALQKDVANLAEKFEEMKREEERIRESCSHVYVGKVFSFSWTATMCGWLCLSDIEYTKTGRFVVLGFNPETGEVSARCESGDCRSYSDGTIVVSCSDVR